MLNTEAMVVHFSAAPVVCYPQIHRLKKTEDLVGACYKAGYDGKCRYKTITNEVKLLCRKHVCLSTTPRRVSRQE